MKIAIPDMANDGRSEPGCLNIFLCFYNTFGKA